MPNSQMSRVSLQSIPPEDLPLLVLTDNMTSWVSRKIKKHSKGYYSHVMWMDMHGVVVSQGWMLKQEHIQDWLEGDHRVKLWRNPDWTIQERNRIQYWLDKQLARPWYRRAYDWVGLIGQAVRIKSINLPHRRFCSEAAAEVLSKVEPYDRKHPSPADLNRWCKANPQMEVYGVYDPDLEVER